jgi:hypothetical protein
MAKADFVHQTQTTRRVASNPACRWRFKRHALEKMELFHPPVTQPDVKNAVTKGHVVLEEAKRDLLWRVVGPDLDGNNIKVVVAVYEAEVAVKIVTVF